MKPKIVAFTSGKGGVGKSNISLNTALALTEIGKRTLLVDLDFGLANIEILLNLKPIRTMQQLPSLNFDLSQIVVKGPWGLDLISCGRGFSWLNSLSTDDRNALIRAWREFCGDYELILLDTSPTLDENSLLFLACSDLVVLLTSPELTSVLDTYTKIKTLANQFRFKNFGIFVNCVESEKQAVSVFSCIAEAAFKHLNVRVTYLGSAPFDSYVQDSVQIKQPFLVSFPSSKASKSVRSLAECLLAECLQFSANRLIDP